MRFDHVALASRDSQAVLRTLVCELGGTVLQGALSVGFRTIHVRMGDATRGMTIELIEPHKVERNDFLDRFLQRQGPGPHHLTLKVDDLVAEVDRLRDLGLHPTGVSIAPRWKECFLRPAEAHGTVVQLAQGGIAGYPSFAEHFADARAGKPYGEPLWWDDPGPRAPDVTFVERVVVATPDLAGARALYADVLRGRVVDETDDRCDLTWPGGAVVRLVADASRPAGIARLECTGPGPARTLTLAGTDFVIA